MRSTFPSSKTQMTPVKRVSALLEEKSDPPAKGSVEKRLVVHTLVLKESVVLDASPPVKDKLARQLVEPMLA